MIHVGNYIFNTRYVRWVRLIKFSEDTTQIHINVKGQLDASGDIKFSFDTHKEAEGVFKLIKREMSGEG